MEKSDFSYKTIKSFAVLSSAPGSGNKTYTKEFNLISFNEAPPVYDVRNWTQYADGERRMGKGVTLNRDEVLALKESLNQLDS